MEAELLQGDGKPCQQGRGMHMASAWSFVTGEKRLEQHLPSRSMAVPCLATPCSDLRLVNAQARHDGHKMMGKCVSPSDLIGSYSRSVTREVGHDRAQVHL